MVNTQIAMLEEDLADLKEQENKIKANIAAATTNEEKEKLEKRLEEIEGAIVRIQMNLYELRDNNVDALE